jgi:hypothetical protein
MYVSEGISRKFMEISAGMKEKVCVIERECDIMWIY